MYPSVLSIFVNELSLSIQFSKSDQTKCLSTLKHRLIRTYFSATEHSFSSAKIHTLIEVRVFPPFWQKLVLQHEIKSLVLLIGYSCRRGRVNASCVWKHYWQSRQKTNFRNINHFLFSFSCCIRLSLAWRNASCRVSQEQTHDKQSRPIRSAMTSFPLLRIQIHHSNNFVDRKTYLEAKLATFATLKVAATNATTETPYALRGKYLGQINV